MPDDIPLHLRPITFAANELTFELIYLLQSYTGKDLESILITLCVNDATMRPFMVATPPTPEILVAARPKNEIRGAISRRMIADKTGLSRETVRRKTQELSEAGLIVIDDEDRIRSAQRLDEPDFQLVIEAAHRAVMRYRQLLEAFGVPWECVRPPS